jgi:hypothetical protein
LDFEPPYAMHTYLKFPLLVKDRKKFFSLAEEKKYKDQILSCKVENYTIENFGRISKIRL